jgi:hypothetical protein
MRFISHSGSESDNTLLAEVPSSLSLDSERKLTIYVNDDDFDSGVCSSIRHLYLQQTSLIKCPNDTSSDASGDTFKGALVQVNEEGSQRMSNVAIRRLRAIFEDCHHVVSLFRSIRLLRVQLQIGLVA